MKNALIDRYIEWLITESTPEQPVWNMEHILQGRPPQWNYIDGCMMTALWSLYEQTGDQRYFRFVSDFYDFYVAEDGSLLDYRIEDYNLDQINEGRVLFDLYSVTGNEKYQHAIRLLHRQLTEQPRTQQGNYWHKEIYPHQVWLDGFYMAQVFAMRWALAQGAEVESEEIARQFAIARDNMYIAEKGLYCHGYDETHQIFWADSMTGRSKNFWLRSIGWFLAAMVDVLGYKKNETLAVQFLEAAEGLLPYMDDTGLFWQVVDQGNRPGNYMETSGSAMAAYAFLKGARLGFLPQAFLSHGQRVFDGICKHRLSEKDGRLQLSGICLVAGLGPANNLRRDGSYEYYISEPVVENDAKGVAPFLLCYTEMLRL